MNKTFVKKYTKSSNNGRGEVTSATVETSSERIPQKPTLKLQSLYPGSNVLKMPLLKLSLPLIAVLISRMRW